MPLVTYSIKTKETPGDFIDSSFELAASPALSGKGLNALGKKIVEDLVGELPPDAAVKVAIRGRYPSKGDFWWNQVRQSTNILYCVGIMPERIKVWLFNKPSGGQWSGLSAGHVGDNGLLKEITLNENERLADYTLTAEDVGINNEE